jgi:hypothetical protein
MRTRLSPLGLLEAMLFPRWLTLSIWPMVAMAAASALGNFFGSKSAAKSQAEAQDRTNAANLQMFHESRGSTGSAILPEYMKSTEGALGADAAAAAQAMFGWGGSAGNRLTSAQGTLAKYNPAIEAGDGLVYDLASGKAGQQRQASLAPVLAARTNVAKGRAAAINKSLDETLANLRAGTAKSGFRGGGTFDTNRALASMVGARQAAANEFGMANLENAQATHGIDETNLQLLLQSLDLPFQRGQQALAYQGLPLQQLSQQYQAALAPMNFFRMGQGQAPYQQNQPIANTGQIAGAAVGSLGSTLGQYYAQQQMMQDLKSFYNPSGATATSWTGSGGDPGTAWQMPSLGGWAGTG